MDKAQAKLVQTEAHEAVKAVFAKHGLRISGGSAKFDDASFSITIKGQSTSPADHAVTWANYAPVFGLPVDGFGAVITLNRKQFRITGLDLNRRSFPVVTQDVATGKVTLFREDAVRRALLSRISVES